MRKIIGVAIMSVLVLASFPAAAQMKIAVDGVIAYQLASQLHYQAPYSRKHSKESYLETPQLKQCDIFPNTIGGVLNRDYQLMFSPVFNHAE